MTVPFFSVIIPLYNKGKHIKRTLDSVLVQEYQDFEIIVVDDGSVDDGPTIVEGIGDRRVRLIRKKNGGVSSARNLGARMSSGQYLAFLDADDLWQPQFTSAIAGLIKEYPDGGAYGSDWFFEDNGIRTTQRRSLSKGQLDFFDVSVHRSSLCSSATVVPKEVFFHVGGYDERLSYGEDIDLWFRLADKYKIYTTGSHLAVYVLDSDNRACIKRGIDLEKRFPYYIPPYKGLVNKQHKKFYFKYITAFLFSLLNDRNYSYYIEYLNKHFSVSGKLKAVVKSLFLVLHSRAAIAVRRSISFLSGALKHVQRRKNVKI